MMLSWRILAIVAGAHLAAGLMPAELNSVRAEPNLEKRAAKAMEHAGSVLEKADKAHESGDWPQALAALQETRESVELAFTSLKQTGKNPRRSPKHFKRAEISTRKLLKELEDLRLRLGIEEREQIESVRKYIQDVHDDLIEGIMGTGEWKPK